MKLHGNFHPDSHKTSSSHLHSATHSLNSTLAQESQINRVEGKREKNIFRSLILRDSISMNVLNR